MEANLYNQAGEQIGSIALDEYIFGVTPNVALMHQYVVMQHANARLGTHNTKGRGEVKGSTRKLYRQKGTGRARQGSVRAPHRPGGGVAHGPHPRKYTKNMPRKMRRLAVRSALSVKFAADQIRFVDAISFDVPRTRNMLSLLEAHAISGKTLLVLDTKNEASLVVQRSANNLPNVKTLWASYINVRDLLACDTVVMLKGSVEVLEGFLAKSTRPSLAAEEAA
ncbi:50S ribosomal protein L4 [Candidatus Gracilibacteria bacterium]|nr:50S ribosomal protein L4 [Candidatus Gracilibacteria bacterium]